MSTEKMREEFQAAYIEGLVARCGEGFRSSVEYSLEQRRPDGEYLNYPDFIAWWAWQASRAAIEVEIPAAIRLDTWQDDLEQCDDGCLIYIHDLIDLIESLGLKVKP